MKANQPKRKLFNDAVDLLTGDAPDSGIQVIPVDQIKPFHWSRMGSESKEILQRSLKRQQEPLQKKRHNQYWRWIKALQRSRKKALSM